MKPVPDYTPEIALRFDPFAALSNTPPSPRLGVSAVFYPLDPIKIETSYNTVFQITKARESLLFREYYLVDIYDDDRQRAAQLCQVSPSPLATTWESRFFETIWWLPQQAEAHAEHVAYPDPDYECKLDPVSLKWATDNYMLLTAITTLGENHKDALREMATLQGVPSFPLDDVKRVSFQAIQDAFVWDLERINLPYEVANQLRR